MRRVMQRVIGLSSEGFSCSQILMTMALEDSGRSNPRLVKAMAGLAMGCGTGAATCGVLTGAACVLGMHEGEGNQENGPSASLSQMLAELHQWFIVAAEAPQGEVSCQAVLGSDVSSASLQKCAKLMAMTHIKLKELLAVSGEL